MPTKCGPETRCRAALSAKVTETSSSFSRVARCFVIAFGFVNGHVRDVDGAVTAQCDRAVRADRPCAGNGRFGAAPFHLNAHGVERMQPIRLLGNHMDRLDREQVGRLDDVRRQHRLLEFPRDAGRSVWSGGRRCTPATGSPRDIRSPGPRWSNWPREQARNLPEFAFTAAPCLTYAFNVTCSGRVPIYCRLCETVADAEPIGGANRTKRQIALTQPE